jgi:hypothetical protein
VLQGEILRQFGPPRWERPLRVDNWIRLGSGGKPASRGVFPEVYKSSKYNQAPCQQGHRSLQRTSRLCFRAYFFDLDCLERVFVVFGVGRERFFLGGGLSFSSPSSSVVGDEAFLFLALVRVALGVADAFTLAENFASTCAAVGNTVGSPQEWQNGVSPSSHKPLQTR